MYVSAIIGESEKNDGQYYVDTYILFAWWGFESSKFSAVYLFFWSKVLSTVSLLIKEEFYNSFKPFLSFLLLSMTGEQLYEVKVVDKVPS